jgi:hypothetical protein
LEKALMIGRNEYVANIGASSVFVYMILEAFVVMIVPLYLSC